MLETRTIQMTGDWVHINPAFEYRLVQNTSSNIVSVRVGNTGGTGPERQDGILLDPKHGITDVTAGQGDVYAKGPVGTHVVAVVDVP